VRGRARCNIENTVEVAPRHHIAAEGYFAARSNDGQRLPHAHAYLLNGGATRAVEPAHNIARRGRQNQRRHVKFFDPLVNIRSICHYCTSSCV
jgi:hypothetical protein